MESSPNMNKVLIYLDDQHLSIFNIQSIDYPGYYIYPETNPSQLSFIYPDNQGNYVVQEDETVPYQIFFFNQADINNAVATGNISASKILIEYGIFPTKAGVDAAVINNNLSMIQFLSQYNIFPSENGINMAKTYPDQNIIRFLKNIGYLKEDLSELVSGFQNFGF